MWQHLRTPRFLNVRRYGKKRPAIKYERMAPLEHVLLRPGMYVGSTHPEVSNTWVYNDETKKMVKKSIYYSPALVKIFDEILVNAADNRWREEKMTFIDVNIGSDEHGIFRISVKNDGEIIPISFDPKEKLHIPELVLGHLMTGSNFDDSEGRVTGGTHGLGAKLSNIFSTAFEVEIYDSQTTTLYRQQWRDNMRQVSPPELLAKPQNSSSYTSITFCPDLARFHTAAPQVSKTSVDASDVEVAGLADVVAVMGRRVVDLCGVGLSGGRANPIRVTLNGQTLSIKSLADYMSLFPLGESEPKVVSVGDRWEVGVAQSPSGVFEHMSFVNSVQTVRGGTHVNHIAAQCVKHIDGVLAKLYGSETSTLTSASIKGQLMLFIRCLIENPSFDSQSKDLLTTKTGQFGSKCTLPSAFLKSCFQNSDIVDGLLKQLQGKERSKALTPVKGQFGKDSIDVEGLQDAHHAGVPGKSTACTLIVTEGESAKALAVAGLEVVGRKSYGVIALKGKVMNVLHKSRDPFKSKQIMKLCQVMGLQHNKDYDNEEDYSTLRYGHIMLMTDQDEDGSHIKGLVINLLNTYWPNLLRREGFIKQFCTPLVKVFSGGAKKEIIKEFYTNVEFEKWMQDMQEQSNSDPAVRSLLKGATVKYYKGLGTSTAEEGRAYFRNLKYNVKNFVDGPNTSEALDLVFGPDRVEDRKTWLLGRDASPETEEWEQKDVSYEEFVHKDLIEFSFANIYRTLPSVVDGLKPSQRKVLYTCLSKDITSDLKVVQLAGSVAELTSYHHGESSLIKTIVKMAQDFVGSNNIPLLVPSGQFGTRHSGGDDAASPRYIFTRLSPITKFIFPDADSSVLTHVWEEGKQVEPLHYLPVIPMLLVNGCFGVGTGFQTSVPTFNPIELCDHVANVVRGSPQSMPLVPWFRGHKGEIKWNGEHFLSCGLATRKNKTVVEIEELPWSRWTEAYKESMMLHTRASRLRITGLQEDHTVNDVKFTLRAASIDWDSYEIKRGGLVEKLGLVSNILSGSMYAFDSSQKLVRYPTPEDIVMAHYEVRLEGYRARREKILAALTSENVKARNKARFISDIHTEKIELMSGGKPQSTELLVRSLQEGGYDLILEGSQQSSGSSHSEGFKYLLDMPIGSLTTERSVQLNKSAENTQRQLEDLKRSSAKDLWIKDIDFLRAELLKDPSMIRQIPPLTSK